VIYFSQFARIPFRRLSFRS